MDFRIKKQKKKKGGFFCLKMDLELFIFFHLRMSQQHTNYLRLKQTIKEVEDSGYNQRSVEWYRQHYTILQSYRDAFSNLNHIDLEIKDTEFRETSSLSENLLKRLMFDFEHHGWFGLYDYIKLNRLLVFLTDYSMKFYKDDDELSLLLKNLKVC